MSSKCERCGGELPPGSSYKRRFCDKCRIANEKDRQRRASAENRQYGSWARNRKTLDNLDKPKKSLSQCAKEAHQLKLTYGKYMELIAGNGLKRYCDEHGYKMPGDES